MIPARLGSQRLKKKNLRLLHGLPLITHAIRKCKDADCFDSIWVNTESDEIGHIAEQEQVGYHKRPSELANNQATSEDFVYEFMSKHTCDYVVQVHSIAPLLLTDELQSFVKTLEEKQPDTLLSVVNEQLECLYDGNPINFTFQQKHNSQELIPVQRISWSISAWKRDTFIKAKESGQCATYAGDIEVFPVSKAAGHVIKTEGDLVMAEAMLAT